MAHTPTLTLELSEEERERLRQIAKQHGLLVGRGSQADWGSIRGLNQAIAAGDLVPVARPILEQALKRMTPETRAAIEAALGSE